ncbi:ribosomal protein L1 [Methanohalobium evestigatum Z-7303]|jgi:large subunit ribosomal protein L1|uniref:Large ribosomal subunit protein uL1 n=1 Tax=Methanohalobium evestigatum (strain ATCC BAA-1072 / DSM 3721 / NBRC 107634 / OCM 161 / Z-7303) TaxID=644295 RepID=D7EAE0_METEZ|nr:50S ribosomal protein L1 [Methanohalobium evestigatum]ADI74939.1 ribosomal protein L1 [Methanohalobium evestigatum Z-7303]
MADQSTIDAVNKLLEESPNRNFPESVDLAINLKNLDLSKPHNRVDKEISLPHGLGKSRNVCVFAKGEVGLKAKDAGAKYVFSDEDIDDLASDKKRAKSLAKECDLFIAEAQYMPTIGKALGTVLGPRGKMPTPLTPNKDVSELIKSAQNTVHVRSKDNPSFHVSVGQRNEEPDKLADNIDAVISGVENSLEKGRQNLRSVYVTTTMGSSVKVV